MRRKHLLYLGSERLDAWLWESGRLTGPASFAATRAGLDAFMDYLGETGPDTPALLLADLVEEDFQRLLVPHVGGKAGRNLLERRLLQQYRETPYRQATVQGRAAEGRRDDIVLCSALTNPALLQPWTEAMEWLKVPLAGVYSVPLLSEELAGRLGVDREHEHLLLVTKETAGLRQSYFHNGQLKFSRLTLAIDREGMPANAGVETARTQQFLVSVRLLERGEVLNAVMVAQDEELERWAGQCESGTETVYHLIPLGIAAGLAGIEGLAGSTPLADPLFLELLARTRPPSHYRLGEVGRYYRLWQIRTTLFSSTVAVAACGLLWVLGNVWAYVDARRQGDRLSLEAVGYDASYRISMSDMPPALAPTANMKAAVTVERLLAQQAPRPAELLTMLSSALDKVPQVQIARLDWRVDGAAPPVPAGPAGPAAGGRPSGPGTGAGPNAMPARLADAAAAAGQEAAPIPSRLLGIPVRPPQTLRVEAEVPLMQNNARGIVESMNRFAQELARNPRLTVEIERPALDVSPNARLSGRTGPGAGDKPAQFVLNLSLKP
ncbi:hypothetical protein LJR289_002282 [Pseudoduganella sp. LjRoot289]|uniref:hypothetical protein n=1 Tax=Pseudoduganella sp. LjRoot289 TaxID=3342314 RepID=UPI003ECF6DD9